MNGNDVDKQETRLAVVQSKMIKQVVPASLKCPIRQHHEIVFEELLKFNFTVKSFKYCNSAQVFSIWIKIKAQDKLVTLMLMTSLCW